MRRGILICLVVSATVFGITLVKASGAEEVHSSWATPSAKALLRVSSVTGAQNEPNFLSNLDCQTSTYRLVASHEMRTGCFTPTAVGLFDVDTGTVIFNGTDEALPVLPASQHQGLIPWNSALNLITIDTAVTGGSYINMYKNPLSSMQDRRNLSGQLTSKQLTSPPELQLTDEAGRPLLVNAQTMAMSDGGSWMVAETLYGSFVRINLATLDSIAFAPAFGSRGSPALLKSRVTVSEDGRYVAIQNDAADSFKVYDLSNCTGDATCLSYDYQTFIKSHVSSLQSIRHVRFINNELLSFEVVADETNSGIYELAPSEKIQSLTDYVGLGDSYTSGQGAFDYLSGTDTENNTCHVSIHSYPLLLTKDLFNSNSGHSVACSGAVIKDIGSTSATYKGQMRGISTLSQLQKEQPELLESVESNFNSGYIAQHRFVKRWQPRVTTVSIGGNDIGFGKILQQCVIPHISLHASDDTCFNTYEDRLEVLNLIDKTIPRWSALYKQLQSESPGSQIYAIGYPDIIDDTGNCALNVHLGKSELEFAAELVVYINKSMRQASMNAGVPYVDVSKAFYGHRLCETASHNVAVNGLTAGHDKFVFGSESFHPNAFGQQLLEQEILRQTHNLTLRNPSSAEGNTSGILNKPKTNREVTNRLPVEMTEEVLKKGSTISIAVYGSLLKPNTTYQVHIDGPAGSIIGTLNSNSEGNIQNEVTIPPDTSSGGHTFDVVGNDPADNTIDATQPVYIPNNEADSDGDGIPDAADSCRAILNSAQDYDHDGVDDTCDPLIGQPPITVTTTNGTSSSHSTSGISISHVNESHNAVVATFITGLPTATTHITEGSHPLSTVLGSNTINPNNIKQRGSRLQKTFPTPSKLNSWHNPKILWWLWLLGIPLLLWFMVQVISYLAERILSQ